MTIIAYQQQIIKDQGEYVEASSGNERTKLEIEANIVRLHLTHSKPECV